LNIIYDHAIFCAQPVGGVSRYFVELATAVQASGEARVTINAPCHVSQLLEAAEPGVRTGRRLPVFPGVTKLTGLVGAAAEHRLPRNGILHSTWYRKRPSRFRNFAVTVHDMIAEKFPNEVRASERQTRIKRASADAADVVFCVSECTRQDLLERYPWLEAKVVVTPLATRIGTLAAAPLRSNVPYILYVGRRSGYKNFSSFARAFASARELRGEFRLVCFGGEALSDGEVASFGLSAGAGFGDVSRITGDDLALASAYRGASLVVVTSTYEGFGLPVLEALSCAAPVLTSSAGSLREVGGDAVNYVTDTLDVAEWRDALVRLLDRSRLLAEMARSKAQNGSDCTWWRTAALTIEAYRGL
jgi:glycosyltransferase involved in cell wall biosynthesis